MGDRRMVQINTEHGKLYIYSHSCGAVLPDIVKEAVDKAKPRLGDEPYWLAIFVDQVTKEGRDQETGWGLMLKPHAEDEYNYNNPSIIVDASTGEITIEHNRL